MHKLFLKVMRLDFGPLVAQRHGRRQRRRRHGQIIGGRRHGAVPAIEGKIGRRWRGRRARQLGHVDDERRIEDGRWVAAGRRFGRRRFEQSRHFRIGRHVPRQRDGRRVAVADARIGAGIGATVLGATAPLIELRAGERDDAIEPAADAVLPVVAFVFLL